MLDLRKMKVTYDSLMRAISGLRIAVMTSIVLSGTSCVLALLMKAGAFQVEIAWPHFVGFGIVVLSIVVALVFLFRVLRAMGRTDCLVSNYVDLS